MMSGLVATLPLQLICQLLSSANSGCGNVTVVDDTYHTAVLPGGYTPFPELGVAYKFYKNPVTWDVGRKLCIGDGANLAIVDSYKKVEYIMEMKDKNQGTWTGVHRLFNSKEWISITTGLPPDFIPWRPNAHSDTGFCIANRHDILGVSPWNCDSLVPVICEVTIPTTSSSQMYHIKVKNQDI